MFDFVRSPSRLVAERERRRLVVADFRFLLKVFGFSRRTSPLAYAA
jgi:hypothetical protein